MKANRKIIPIRKGRKAREEKKLNPIQKIIERLPKEKQVEIIQTLNKIPLSAENKKKVAGLLANYFLEHNPVNKNNYLEEKPWQQMHSREKVYWLASRAISGNAIAIILRMTGMKETEIHEAMISWEYEASENKMNPEIFDYSARLKTKAKKT